MVDLVDTERLKGREDDEERGPAYTNGETINAC